MKSINEQRFLESIDHIDDRIVSDVIGKVDEKKKMTYRPRKRSFTAWAVSAAAVAACLLLIGISIPREPMITVDSTNLLPPVNETNLTEEVNTAPEYDGSRGLIYEVNEDGETASFVGFGTCTDEVVYIASTYNGLPVTEMRNKKLFDAENNRSHMWDYGSHDAKRIVVSDSVTDIHWGIVEVCPNIESIYLGANVDFVRAFAIGSSHKFSTIEVSPDNENFSDKGNCLVDLRTKTLVVGLSNSVIPDDGSVVIIGQGAFASADSLTSIVIPEGVRIIEHDAFMGCKKLESVTLPDSLELIDTFAFYLCKSLKTLVIGANLKVFPQNVFHSQYCPTLYYKGTVEQWESILMPNDVNDGRRFISIPVICSDGETLSDAGIKGEYNWRYAPEFEWYWYLRYSDTPWPNRSPWLTENNQ